MFSSGMTIFTWIKMMMKKTIKSLLVLVCVGCIASTVSDAEVKFPSPSGFINDYAKIIPSSQRIRLENILNQIERRSGAEVTVLTVPSTAPLTIEQYAVRVFEKWGIGKKGKDNGLLILVASNDRKIRIEVGYGLEGAVTDLESKQIIEQYIVPYFKKGDYGSGIYAGIVVVASLIEREYNIKLDLSEKDIRVAKQYRRKSSPLGSLFTFIFFVMIFGFRFGSLFFLMSGRRGGYWSGGGGGSFGGGFGGFGGGMSGGGGSSGGW